MQRKRLTREAGGVGGGAKSVTEQGVASVAMQQGRLGRALAQFLDQCARHLNGTQEREKLGCEQQF